MIIRRRTYTKGFTSKYGYFMMNADFGQTDQNEGTTWNFPTNIYTQSCINESPIGSFPYSYRQADKVTGDSDQRSFAIGYTVSASTIIVATPKHIYKSTNMGNTWTTVCTLPTYSYWYTWFVPILYADGDNYYLVYGIRSTQASSFYIYIYEYHWNGSTGTTTLLKTQYATYYNALGTISGLYSNKTSPQGQMLLRQSRETGNDRYVCYFMLDMPRKLVSQVSAEMQQSGALTGGYEGAGMWINDGTAYGAWIVQFLGIRNGSNFMYFYYKCPASNFSSSTQPALTDVTTNIATLMNLDTEFQNPQITAATAESYKNLIFWQVGWSFSDSYTSWWVSKADLTNFQQIDISEMPNSLKYNMSPSGLYVSPDGRYGFMMGVWECLAFNLDSRKFLDGMTRDALENFHPNANGNYSTFMQPRFAI